MFCHDTKTRLLSYKSLVRILVPVGAFGTFLFACELESVSLLPAISKFRSPKKSLF